MRKDFVGGFYFKQTSTKNLIGEFFNNDSIDINIESAKRIGGNNDFEGDFKTVWYDGAKHMADLTIQKVNSKYILIWIDSNGINYEGQGFIVDNILTGYYRVKI